MGKIIGIVSSGSAAANIIHGKEPVATTRCVCGITRLLKQSQIRSGVGMRVEIDGRADAWRRATSSVRAHKPRSRIGLHREDIPGYVAKAGAIQNFSVTNQLRIVQEAKVLKFPWATDAALTVITGNSRWYRGIGARRGLHDITCILGRIDFVSRVRSSCIRRSTSVQPKRVPIAIVAGVYSTGNIHLMEIGLARGKFGL